MRNDAALFTLRRGFGFRCAPASATAATTATSRARLVSFFLCGLSNRGDFSFGFQQRIDALVRSFDVMLAIEARLFDLRRRSLLRSRVAFLARIDHDLFEFGFFIEEV